MVGVHLAALIPRDGPKSTLNLLRLVSLDEGQPVPLGSLGRESSQGLGTAGKHELRSRQLACTPSCPRILASQAAQAVLY